MFKARFLSIGVLVAVVATCAPRAFANYIDAVTGSATCSTYSLQVTENGMTPGSFYQFNWDLIFTPSSGAPINVSGSATFTAERVNGVVQNIAEPLGPLTGTYAVSGSVTMRELNNPPDVDVSNPFPVDFAATTMTCSATPPAPTCAKTSRSYGSSNGTIVKGGGSIRFNAKFAAAGIPKTGATIIFSNSTISFTASGKNYNLPVPNGQISFSPNATTVSTKFNSLTNTWNTVGPISGDEIFLAGLSWPVPVAGLPGGVKNVNWQGTFSVSPSTADIVLRWKWRASAYSRFSGVYDDLGVKPDHKYPAGTRTARATKPEPAKVRAAATFRGSTT